MSAASKNRRRRNRRRARGEYTRNELRAAAWRVDLVALKTHGVATSTDDKVITFLLHA